MGGRVDESNAIDKAAVAWVSRLDRGGDDPDLAAEWEAWIHADRRHLGAYVRAEAAWRVMDRVSQLPEDAQRSTPGPSRRMMIGAGLSAAAAAVAAGAVVTPHRRKSVYVTAPREIRRVQLADGSIAAINSETEIEVALGRKARRVKLLRGDAWFQVAKDPDRPFLVESGNMTVRAVGTAFSVRRGEQRTDVLVDEGVVELRPHDRSVGPARLAAGSRAVLAADGRLRTEALARADVDGALAWREAQIALNGHTLQQAAETFNRYNRRKLVISDPALAEETVIGWFRMDDPASFAEVAAEALNAQVDARPDRIVLARRSERAAR
jgi:transmembrane sensor